MTWKNAMGNNSKKTLQNNQEINSFFSISCPSLKLLAVIFFWYIKFSMFKFAKGNNSKIKLHFFYLHQEIYLLSSISRRESNGSVLECLTRDWGAVGSSLTGVTALYPWARHIYPNLELVQPLPNWKINDGT